MGFRRRAPTQAAHYSPRTEDPIVAPGMLAAADPIHRSLHFPDEARQENH